MISVNGRESIAVRGLLATRQFFNSQMQSEGPLRKYLSLVSGRGR